MDPITLAIVVAAAGGGLWAVHKSSSSTSSPPTVPPAQIPPVLPGSNPPPGVVPPPPQPPPVPPPTPAPVLPPGVYPAGTPGAVPVQVIVSGGDGDSNVLATPGGYVGPQPGSMKVIWYGPGTRVVFTAQVSGFSPFTSFDHWEGPNGVQTRSNPIAVAVQQAGFVKAVFSFLGRT